MYFCWDEPQVAGSDPDNLGGSWPPGLIVPITEIGQALVWSWGGLSVFEILYM